MIIKYKQTQEKVVLFNNNTTLNRDSYQSLGGGKFSVNKAF